MIVKNTKTRPLNGALYAMIFLIARAVVSAMIVVSQVAVVEKYTVYVKLKTDMFVIVIDAILYENLASMCFRRKNVKDVSQKNY